MTSAGQARSSRTVSTAVVSEGSQARLTPTRNFGQRRQVRHGLRAYLPVRVAMGGVRVSQGGFCPAIALDAAARQAGPAPALGG